MTRRLWTIGREAYLGSLAPVDRLQVDVLLTTAVLGAQQTGLYFVASSATAVVRVWGSTFGLLALPRVAAAATSQERLVRMSRYVRLTLLLSGLLAAVLVVFAGPLLTLVYGGSFREAQTIVRILTAGMLAASLRFVIGDGLRGMGEPHLATRAEVAGWVAGLAVLALTLSRWGAGGVAIAVTTSYVTTLLVMLRYATGVGARLSDMLVPRRTDVSLSSRVKGARVSDGPEQSGRRRTGPGQ